MRPLSQDVSSLSSGKSHHILISNGKIYLKENLETHGLHLFAIKYNEAVESKFVKSHVSSAPCSCKEI